MHVSTWLIDYVFLFNNKVLHKHSDATMVAIVHGETSSGVMNPVEEVGKLVHEICPNACYFVDAMSTFGGIPLDLNKVIHHRSRSLIVGSSQYISISFKNVTLHLLCSHESTF